MDILLSILIGGAAGWLASFMYKGKSNGWLWNILLGIGGGIVGKFIFGILGFGVTHIIGNLIVSVVGALLIVWAYKKWWSKE
ncbi:MAG: GlsB/YeaQ/YmgE family stress response membrane protein [Cytophagaceae bacterium]|jgi:uncharacterized membrane protein YeaQ/YmgE (transglycosylase-associated protein family)|nr:GlsB/YeaQ/YmgE family stress response membrane protein [Cytophagaceae bacterium]